MVFLSYRFKLLSQACRVFINFTQQRAKYRGESVQHRKIPMASARSICSSDFSCLTAITVPQVQSPLQLKSQVVFLI